jgi:hypothetical protein
LSFVFLGMAGLLSVLAGNFLSSILNVIILRPAIRDQLKKKSQNQTPSV